MRKAAAFLVEKRRIFLCLFLLLAAVSVLLMGQVRINYDLTEYLPADSRMKQGIQRMEQEFGREDSSQLRVMLPGLNEAEKEEVYQWLAGLDQVSEVTWKPGKDYNRDGYTLFEIKTEYDSHSGEAAELFNAVHEMYDSRGAATGGNIHEANVPLLPLYTMIAAVGLVLVILLLMCNSWFEPVIFMVNIGIAVVLNLGTNLVFSSVSEYTNSIVAILQLVLSMDYSIILLNRYSQEKEKNPDNESAMKAAITAAFPAVAGSSLTTFAGLLCLGFMSFKLGADMGFALAKSVIVSMICIFTVLPSLILLSDRWIVKTRKKALHIPAARVSRFEYRGRVALLIGFLALFIGAFLLKNNTEILYMMQMNNKVDQVFGEKNSLVLLYERKDADRIAEALAPLEEDDHIAGITGYYNTLGKKYRADEITELFSGADAPDSSLIRLVYTDRFAEMEDKSVLSLFTASMTAYDDSWAMTPEELVSWLQDHIADDPRFTGMISHETRQMIADAGQMIRENAERLEGKQYGRVILTTVYPEDSEETRAFLNTLSERCEGLLEGETWLIGTSAMNREMAQTFDAEMNRITLISALAIFVVVALTFRSLIIPLILVLTVQCGIYLTMTFIGLSGGGMYYLAILMVQCILMGATVDYAILYTSYYREQRLHADRPEAISGAYAGSLHTILTSASIMIVAAGILGFVFANPAIGEICLTISRGAISATLIIVFILPGVLAALDRFVRFRNRTGR
jgi:predicted RND superfamily exporter protein